MTDRRNNENSQYHYRAHRTGCDQVVIWGLAEGLQQFASEEFGSRVIRKVEILSERISGNQAEVHYILYDADGTQDPEGSDIFVKEKGQWKIGLSF